MRVVVTGGSGRLGQYVVRELFTHAHGVLSLDVIKPRECLCPTQVVDLQKFEAVASHLKGADAVVHLARIRFPYTENGFDRLTQRWEFTDRAGDTERFQQNVAMTNNVLAAADDCGIRRIVCGSSLAVYGFYYPTRVQVPDYLPVDEDHPRRPQDPYGLTKLIGEQLCEALALRTGAQVASLRFAGVYTEAHRAMLLDRKKDPLIRGTGALWSYVDVRDAARACRLALETNFSGHQAFNICAPVALSQSETTELVDRYLPSIRRIRDDLQGSWSGYDTKKAEGAFGFRALHLI